MSIVYCTSCEGKVSKTLDNCPHCGHPVNAAGLQSSKQSGDCHSQQEEKDILCCRPCMFRNAPILFILCILLIPLYGAGLLILIIWWLQCLTTRFYITTKKSVLRKGILSKHTNEVRHCDIRNIQVKQWFSQRIFSTGKIYISSAAQGGIEIEINGIKAPQKVAQTIREFQE